MRSTRLSICCQSDEHLTQRVYRRLAKDQPDMPPMSVIDAHARKHATTFSTMRDALIMKRAERIAASSL